MPGRQAFHIFQDVPDILRHLGGAFIPLDLTHQMIKELDGQVAYPQEAEGRIGKIHLDDLLQQRADSAAPLENPPFPDGVKRVPNIIGKRRFQAHESRGV